MESVDYNNSPRQTILTRGTWGGDWTQEDSPHNAGPISVRRLSPSGPELWVETQGTPDPRTRLLTWRDSEPQE